jgi:hypothetical protein
MRTPSTVTAALVASAVLSAAAAGATTTTTSTPTSTTTTTTLLPHPLSRVTRTCVRRVRHALRVCKRATKDSRCVTDYETAFGTCFAPRTWLFAFRNVCDALDLDADAVRRHFHAERARSVPAAPQPRAVRALAAGA